MEDSSSPRWRPRPGTKTGRVWELADSLSAQGRRAGRKDVMRAFAEEGGNANTAATQYSLWRRDFDVRHAAAAPAEPGTVGERVLQVGRDGRLLIPADMRAAMLLEKEAKVTAWVENGELRVMAAAVASARLGDMPP